MRPNPFTDLVELHHHLMVLERRVAEERDPLLRAAREDQIVAVLALINTLHAGMHDGQADVFEPR